MLQDKEYTSEERQHRAAEAMRLTKEPLLDEAISVVRTKALGALAVVSPTDTSEIYRLQAVLRCTEELVSHIFQTIVAGGSMDGGVSNDTTEA